MTYSETDKDQCMRELLERNTTYRVWSPDEAELPEITVVSYADGGVTWDVATESMRDMLTRIIRNVDKRLLELQQMRELRELKNTKYVDDEVSDLEEWRKVLARELKAYVHITDEAAMREHLGMVPLPQEYENAVVGRGGCAS